MATLVPIDHLPTPRGTPQNDPEEDLNEWLPVTASRKAKWYYSAFHNVTAMVGAGVLSLPYAMSELGWGPGISVLVLSWLITFYTLWQMVEMHEMDGKRYDRYHELGQAAFGRKLGIYIVVPQQLLVQVSVCIVYMATGGLSLKRFYNLVAEDCDSLTLRHFIFIFASSQVVLSPLRTFNSISGLSFAAAAMSLSYSTIIWLASASKGKQEHASFGYGSQTTGTAYNAFSGLGAMAFAYAGHNVVLEIQATLASTPEKPSKGPMIRGSTVAYVIVAICYFPVAIVGYWVFGNKVEENILFSLDKPRWLIALASMLVAIHLVGSYQVYAMPVFDMAESLLIRIWHFRPSTFLRLTVRYVFVAFTMAVAVGLPYFNALLSFFGGFVLAPTSYFLPCIIWIILKRPRRFGLTWWINMACIFFGVVLMILAPIGGLGQLIYQIKHNTLNERCIV